MTSFQGSSSFVLSSEVILNLSAIFETTILQVTTTKGIPLRLKIGRSKWIPKNIMQIHSFACSAYKNISPVQGLWEKSSRGKVHLILHRLSHHLPEAFLAHSDNCPSSQGPTNRNANSPFVHKDLQ